MPEVISRQKVIDGAARLFGELGYDGTPLQLIADALGVSTATIVEVVGDKRVLYEEVMRQAYEAERDALAAAVSQASTGRAAVHDIADAYLDFHVENRRNRALWAHRWVADAADMSELEERYARPLFALVGSRIKDAVPEDVGTYYLLGTMVWCVHGFLGSGLFHRSKGVWTADDPDAVESFRGHLHVLVDRLLAPAPDERPDTGPAAPGSR